MRASSLLFALLLSAVWNPGPAKAGAVPSPVNSTIPGVITLVGQGGFGYADPFGTFSCTIRDLANNPRAGVDVVIDFSSCPGMRVCADQNQPGVTVECLNGGTARVHKLTDALGVVTLAIMGCSDPQRGSAADRVRIYADGELLGSAIIAAFDLEGCNGVGAGDLSRWLDDFGSGLNWNRCDYDGSGSVGVGDLSVWLTMWGRGRSLVGCSYNQTYPCPYH